MARRRRNGPHSRKSAASGPFPQVVAGGGFEPPKAKPTVLQTSVLLPESYAADLRVCVPRCGSGPPPSAMRPRAPRFGGRATHGRRRSRPRTARVGTVMPTFVTGALLGVGGAEASAPVRAITEMKDHLGGGATVVTFRDRRAGPSRGAAWGHVAARAVSVGRGRLDQRLGHPLASKTAIGSR